MSALKPVLRPVLRSPLWRPLGDESGPLPARGFRLPPLQFSGAGAVPIAGAGAMSLPRLRLGGAGAVGGPNGGGGMVLPAMRFGGSGSPVVQASGGMSLPPIQFRGTGDVDEGDTPSASGGMTLPALQFRGAADPVVTAAGRQSLPALRLGGSGHVVPLADGRLSLPPLAFRGSGTPIVQADGGLTLPQLSFSGTGTVESPSAGITQLDFIERETASTGGTTRTESVTLTAGTNKYLLVGIESFDNKNVNSVTLNGTALTELNDVAGASQECMAIYEMRDADITTGSAVDLVVTFSSSSSEAHIIHLVHLAGVDQTTPIDAAGVGPTQFTGSTSNLGITTATANAAILAFCYDFDSPGGGTFTAGFTSLASMQFVEVFINLDVGAAGAKTAVYTSASPGNNTCASKAIRAA